MDLKEVMEQKTFAIAGDTLNNEKYAYEIKQKMIENGYTVFSVGKELSSFNEIPDEIDIIDLCIHPSKGLPLLKECKKTIKNIVIQPGAKSEELIQYLEENQIPYIESCLLVGLSLYR